jgi:hypothetical protein
VNLSSPQSVLAFLITLIHSIMKVSLYFMLATMVSFAASGIVNEQARLVDCNAYQNFIDHKCEEQQQESPDLLGGWCGRPPACLNGDTVQVPESEEKDYENW